MADFLRWQNTRLNLDTIVFYEYTWFAPVSNRVGLHRLSIHHQQGNNTIVFDCSEDDEEKEDRLFKLIAILDKHFECEQEGRTRRVQEPGL